MDNDLSILAGTLPVKSAPLPLFSPLVLEFLADLETALRTSENRSDNELSALAFWLRRRHLQTFASITSLPQQRLGRGIILHIAPTNIPSMFAYSLIISLLAGNNNIVRISPRTLKAASPLIRLIAAVISKPHFRSLHDHNALITYPHNEAITAKLCANCDGRVIWGGDDSINAIRSVPLPPQAIELAFADRYSLAIFDAQTIARCSDADLAEWAHRFYNDTFAFDQNACSSPHLIIWHNPGGHGLQHLQARWWQAAATAAVGYELAPLKVSRKYTRLWTAAMTIPDIHHITTYNNLLYVCTLSTLPENITSLTGAFGQFFEISLPTLAGLSDLLPKKVQTITVLGLSPDNLRQQLLTSGASGVDRIVPVGQAMEMDIRWDGCNMLESLSRLIC